MIVPTLGSASTWIATLEPWRDSDDIAVITHGENVTGRGMFDLAGRAARWLDDIGAGAGVIPALVTASGRTIALTVAGAGSGRPLALIAPRHTPRELAACIEQHNAPMVICEAAFAESAAAACAAVGRRLVVIPEVLPLASVPVSLDADVDDIVVVLHTSGTTGIPKPVPVRQDRLLGRCRINAKFMGIVPGARFAAAPPYYHVAGFGMVGMALAAGASVVTVEHFDVPTYRSLEPLDVTHVALVPTMISILERDGQLQLPKLKMMQYGAAPMPADLLARVMELLSGVDLVTFYGQTEGTPITSLSGDDHRVCAAGRPDLLLSVGRPVPGTEVRIADPDASGVGEILARGPHLFRPSDDGWLHTGDLGRLDDEGYLFLVGRKGDMIIRGGENIYPAEVEAVLERHRSVVECAVVGQSDAHWGEVVAAFVVASGSVSQRPTPDELRAFCRAELAGFKVPTRWEFVDHLPRNPTGKLLRRELLTLL
ncbi:MAG: class I adenylate-forming enzyme family protein [Acidimicrobiia bacterium]